MKVPYEPAGTIEEESDMNKEWSEMNKKMQTLIGKEATFAEGIDALIKLREVLLKSF